MVTIKDAILAVKDEMNLVQLDECQSRKAFFAKEFRFGFGNTTVSVPNDADVWELMNGVLNELLKLNLDE